MKQSVYIATQNAKKALQELKMPVTRDNILDVLVNYYGLSMRDIEEIKFNKLVDNRQNTLYNLKYTQEDLQNYSLRIYTKEFLSILRKPQT